MNEIHVGECEAVKATKWYLGVLATVIFLLGTLTVFSIGESGKAREETQKAVNQVEALKTDILWIKNSLIRIEAQRNP